MKKLLMLLVVVLAFTYTQAQVKPANIGRAKATINNQTPKDFIIEDSLVRISFNKADLQRLEVNIFNKTDNTITFHDNESYSVINGMSENVATFTEQETVGQKITPGCAIVGF